MEIESYSFGSMQISGQTYAADLILFPDRVEANWWRKEGHSLSLEDLKEVLSYLPEVLIIGTGASGLMQVPSSLIQTLEKRRIEVVVSNTGEAWNRFNAEIRKGRRAVGAFHLTC